MSKIEFTTPVADPQAEQDARGIMLDHVGISNVMYPVLIAGWEASPGSQEMKDGNFTIKVSLNAEKRGIHMSRLVENLHHWNSPLSPSTIPELLTEIRQQQGSQTATMSCDFTWFVERLTPETDRPAWQGIKTTWHGYQDENGTKSGYTLRIPVTTLCPCSRDISDYGAHSQRGWVIVKLEWDEIEDIVTPREIFDKLQHAGSAPIYPLLKRADERHVTMLAYDQPAFVEDTTRKAALLLQQDSRISSFQLDICNEESIHTHDAIASLSFNRTT